MDKRSAIIRMLKQLLEDSVVLHQQGAGYYSCIPVIHSYNKLLGQARGLFPGGGLIDMFEDLRESDPNDPADKMKVMQGVRIEVGQLISLLESMEQGDAERKQAAAGAKEAHPA
jgi:hypothetical protein